MCLAVWNEPLGGSARMFQCDNGLKWSSWLRLIWHLRTSQEVQTQSQILVPVGVDKKSLIIS